MIPERLAKLLTGYVDGELSVRQRKAVQKLLQRSPEARQFLVQLQEDSRELHCLPRARMGRDLTRSVMHAIAIQGVHPGQKRALAHAGLPAWVGLATAAAVLLVIGLASYVYFSAAQGWQNGQSIVAHNNNPPAVVPEPGPEHGLAKSGGADGDAEGVGAIKPRPSNNSGTDVAHNNPKPPDQSQDPGTKPNDNIVASPLKPNEPKIDFQIPHPRLSYHVVRNLDQTDAGKQLLTELQQDPAYRLELFCLDTARGFDRLQAAFKTQNIKLQIDPEAQLRLKYKTPASYAFLLEDVTPEELVKILQYLSAEDKKPTDGQFGKLLVNPMAQTDVDELARMLGVEPAQVPSPRKKSPQGVDIRKPLAETTAAQVAQALGQGSTRPGSEPSKSAGSKSADRPALALAYKVSASKEARLFLDGRKEPRLGALQVLLVLQVPRG